MPTVAEQLRAAREAKKLTVEQVAELTKIRTDHIRALEEGNYDRFPAPIYIRGSVKNYAAKLKLDVTQVMAALDAELSRTKNFAEPPPLVETTKSPLDRVMYLLSKLDAKTALAAAGILGVVLVVVFAGSSLRHRHGNSAPPNLPPAVYQSTNSGDMLPLPRK
jgi:cytoskeletal protein RodZ